MLANAAIGKSGLKLFIHDLIRASLVFQQLWFDGFSCSVSVQGKARLVADGHSPLQVVHWGQALRLTYLMVLW